MSSRDLGGSWPVTDPLPPRSASTSRLAAAQNERFDVVLVDDLSRLARDNYLMLSVIAELHFEGVGTIQMDEQGRP